MKTKGMRRSPRGSRGPGSPRKGSRRLSLRCKSLRKSLRAGSSKCKADDVDVFSQESFSNIPKQRHIRLATFDEDTKKTHYDCFDIVGLAKWMTQKGTNPLTNIPLTDAQKSKIRRKQRKFEETDSKTTYRPRGVYLKVEGTNDLSRMLEGL